MQFIAPNECWRHGCIYYNGLGRSIQLKEHEAEEVDIKEDRIE